MDLLETYLGELREIRASGAAVKETSYYPPLQNLLNEVGRSLKPRVRAIMNLRNRGAGMPDGGLFAADQFQRASDAEPIAGAPPARGVIEAKSTGEDAWVVAGGEQVTRYWGKYRQVLVTNYRDFVLVGEDPDGQPVKLETFRLASGEAAFWSAAANPRKTAARLGASFTEFLQRVLLHKAKLEDPKDVAWFLASYAREARHRISEGGLPALANMRRALEEGLGIRFEGAKGEHFFRSTLVQTLFYGIFSAWVLWSRGRPSPAARFEWRMAADYLRVPILRKLFYEVAEPGQLHTLDLYEVLDWAGAALNRVNRAAFFQVFAGSHAVQYFYEPFLEAFDPELRKELGVWYTPREIVKYMVARVDTVLREELGIPDGLADRRVFVLDPCCGTGAYLVEVLERIGAALREKGGDALAGQDLKRAAMERVFGFEILPAPFVVAHLQLGLLLQQWGAPLSDREHERVGVYLTNALTGWEPPREPKQRLLYPEMEDEREAADEVKREKPILVILGNPPYNGFAGMAVEEERQLSEAYRTTRTAAAPQGQGLNDLYVRFYRMAERRIVEKTGQGVVCFISNYSWLDGLSFTGMRERYLEVFDKLWVDCLNGDKYKTGKVTPEGKPDPSVFSTESNREGIQVGTAIALMVRTAEHHGAEAVRFRHLWGAGKRDELLASADQDGVSLYSEDKPPMELGLPFLCGDTQDRYFSWPRLPELFPVSFPGVKTSRDLDLVEIDLPRLQARMAAYFDSNTSEEALRTLAPSLMAQSARYAPTSTRDFLVRKGLNSGYFVPFAYRPFDVRHVYWHPETKLLDEKREGLFSLYQAGNLFLTSRQKGERQIEGTPFYITRRLPDWHLTRPGAVCFPLSAPGTALFGDEKGEIQVAANLSQSAMAYLEGLAIVPEGADSLWMHALAVGHSPLYLQENSGALRQDWPRIPLPASAELLAASAALGRQVAALLDDECSVPGVTAGAIRPALRVIAPISGPQDHLRPEEGHLDVTAGWGHAGKGGVTMPARGKAVERGYTPAELAAIGPENLELLGATTLDVYLNEAAYWRNIPSRVWEFTIGGYQAIKKWLSYREKPLLGRALSLDEARHVTEMARRIAALLMLSAALDANYRAAKEAK